MANWERHKKKAIYKNTSFTTTWSSPHFKDENVDSACYHKGALTLEIFLHFEGRTSRGVYTKKQRNCDKELLYKKGVLNICIRETERRIIKEK